MHDSPISYQPALSSLSEASAHLPLVPLSDWMQAVIARTEEALERALPAANCLPDRLHAAMRYAVLGGGKRIRALLCHASGTAAGASDDALAMTSAAIEMVHAYSLVHDDLPAMDDDTLRRGRPTVHVQYDEPTAILVGDALQSQAFIALSEVSVSFKQRTFLVRELARAIGSRGMAGGQAIDLMSGRSSLSPRLLEDMHKMKTGSLVVAAVQMGAICGTALLDAPMETPHGSIFREGLRKYALSVGLAYQVVDDILDVTADSRMIGKTPGKDAKLNKPTYTSLYGVDGARAVARDLYEIACAALSPLDCDVRYLQALAELVITRLH